MIYLIDHEDSFTYNLAHLLDSIEPTVVSNYYEINYKKLAELKANKVSQKFYNTLVLGADSVIDLTGELISKPESREEALNILKKLNGKKHSLISSVCISKNGAMIWNHTDSSELKMKNLTDDELSKYLRKIETKTLLDYGVYQIEAGGLELFEYVKGVLMFILHNLNFNSFESSHHNETPKPQCTL